MNKYISTPNDCAMCEKHQYSISLFQFSASTHTKHHTICPDLECHPLTPLHPPTFSFLSVFVVDPNRHRCIPVCTPNPCPRLPPMFRPDFSFSPCHSFHLIPLRLCRCRRHPCSTRNWKNCGQSLCDSYISGSVRIIQSPHECFDVFLPNVCGTLDRRLVAFVAQTTPESVRGEWFA